MERYYKVAFEEAETAIFISNPEGRCLVVNPHACKLTGYSKGELIGKEVLDLFTPDDHIPPVRRADFSQGKTVTAEGRLRCKDGAKVSVELRIKLLPDGKFLDTVQDISERKRAEETLRKNEELFRTAFDHAPTGMSVIAPDGRTYLAVNPLLCEMFGYTRQEFLGNTIQLVTHPDDEEMSNEWIRNKMSGIPCEPVLEKRYLHKDGHVLWGLVSAHWIKNDDGTHHMAIAHIQDISDLKAAEEERKNLQVQLAAALELAHLGHWEYDVESDTFTFNDHFYRIFRTSAEKVGGYTMSAGEYASRFIPPEEQQIFGQEIQKAVEISDPDFSRVIEHRILYEDGTPGHISVHYFVEKDERGRTIRIHGINQDITDRKLAEEERRKLEDQVRQAQKMESIGLLAGGVAHDFNNLLTPILGYTDILGLDLGEENRHQAQLSQIRSAAERAKEVAQRLLAFSRKQLLELKTVDLGDIIRKFENMLRRTIRENIEIHIRISPDLCWIKADPGQIEQVLLNLSINAQDAMPHGGELVIDAGKINLDQDCSTTHQDIRPGSYAILSVKDTGVGIDDEIIDYIFEPFFTTKELGKGTGLGLSTAYGIVKQHDGTILVRSEKGHGSTFEIFLPEVNQERTECIEEDLYPPDDIVYGHETIMVAEDNDMVRSLACDMLHTLGYTVLEAEDPERCIDLVQKHDGVIHLLLTDIIMPKMNGKELYSVLNKMHPELKVVFMSGYASNLIGNQNIIDKDTSFIQKPFSLHKLSDVIRRTLD